MKNDFRSLMESIEDIYNDDSIDNDKSTEDTEDGSEENVTPQEVIKDIILSLKEITNQISSKAVPDSNSVLEELKSVASTLKALASDDEEQADADSDYDTDTLDDSSEDEDEDDLEEACGTEGMQPRIDRNGKQHYENPKGDSYAARKGFVGM